MPHPRLPRVLVLAAALGLGGSLLVSACGTTDGEDEMPDDLVTASDDSGGIAPPPATDEQPPPPSGLPGDPTQQPPGTDPGVDPPGPSVPGATNPFPDPETDICGASSTPCCDGGVCNAGLECVGGTCQLPEREFTCAEAPECFLPPSSTVDADVSVVSTGTPATLNGGAIADSTHRLEAIRLYTEGVFSPIVTIDMESNGQTYGALEFRDDVWSFQADLDLIVTAGAAFFGEIEQPVDFQFDGGGCFEAEGNRIFTDVSDCVDLSDAPAEIPIPNSFTYEVGADYVEMLLLIPNEAIQEAIAGAGGGGGGPGGFDIGALITGDLPLVLRFVPFATE